MMMIIINAALLSRGGHKLESVNAALSSNASRA